MGLTFCVGNPSDALTEPFAARVRRTFAEQFGASVVLTSTDEPYFSEEVAWSGWTLLQEKAIRTLSADQVPHFLSMEAWFGCYIPVETLPGSLEFSGDAAPLAIASLPALVSELEALGTASELPVDEKGLRQLSEQCQNDDEDDDDSMAIQTYAELLLAAHLAMCRRQVLWIVK